MSLLRQGSQYLIIGLLQLLLDWAVFVAASAAGLPPAPANLAGRISGAAAGYWLNGRYTFADGQGSRLGWPVFARFGALWLVMTLLSTVLVGLIAAHVGLRWAWLAKPVVEAGLALANFFLMRRLVYR
jgi:putative flippase GtrA